MKNLALDKHGKSFEFTDREPPTGVGEKVSTVEVSVVFDKGGPTISGQICQRGIYVHITPLTLEKGEQCTFRSLKLFGDIHSSGRKILVMPLVRRSDKKLAEVAERLDPDVPHLAQQFRENPHLAFARVRALCPMP